MSSTVLSNHQLVVGKTGMSGNVLIAQLNNYVSSLPY